MTKVSLHHSEYDASVGMPERIPHDERKFRIWNLRDSKVLTKKTISGFKCKPFCKKIRIF